MDDLKEEKENIDNLVCKTRKNLYEFIENDIDNKTLENISKNIIEKQVKTFQSNLQKNIEDKINEYVKKIKKILKDHFRYCEDFIEALDMQFETSENLTLKTKSGIKKGKLIGGIIGAGSSGWGLYALLTAATPPAGLAVLVGISIVGIITGLWAIISSVCSFFSKKYKKSQQKKAIDKALDDLSKDLEKQIDKNIKNQKIKIKDYNEKIYKKIDDSVYLLNENLDLTYKFLNFLKSLKRKV